MAQVKHKQLYRRINGQKYSHSSSRSKAQINIVDIREEIKDDSSYRLQKIGELLINARIRQINEAESPNSSIGN